MNTSQRFEGRPGELDALSDQQRLIVLQEMLAIPDGPGRLFPFEAERRQHARRLADAPFDRMNAERAVGDVRDPEVLPPGEQVLDADRNHRAERDLEGPAAEIEVAGAAGARM